LVNWPEFTLKKSWGGLPNWVTLSRLLLVIIAPFFCDYTLAVGILALSIVLLDGVDGFLARKLNQITPFGAQLDMETDAFFCLVFSLLISINHPELSWVLIAGSMRYTYKIITSIIAKNGFQESKKKYARYSAGVYFFSLLLFFFMDGTLAKTVLIVGNGLVLVSFSISFYEYFKFNK